MSFFYSVDFRMARNSAICLKGPIRVRYTLSKGKPQTHYLMKLIWFYNQKLQYQNPPAILIILNIIKHLIFIRLDISSNYLKKCYTNFILTSKTYFYFTIFFCDFFWIISFFYNVLEFWPSTKSTRSITDKWRHARRSNGTRILPSNYLNHSITLQSCNICNGFF